MSNTRLSTSTTDTTGNTSDARLAIWLKKLPQNPLAINHTIASQVTHLLKDEDCDSEKLATLIKQDPILCLKLFHCTEKALKKRQGDIQHLIHLIGLIGFNKVDSVTHQSKKYRRHPQGFEEILSASLFAAHLSSKLFNKGSMDHHDRLFLPTLFFNAPLWLMWVAAPKTMAQGQQLASEKQRSYIDLSVKKLGFQLPDLLDRADEFIHLPLLTLKALAINPKDSIPFWAKIHRLSDEKINQWFSQDKQSMHYFHSIEMGIYLLNQYIMAVYLDWNGKHIQRYSDLLCRHLKIDSAYLHTQVMKTALETKLPNQFTGILAPINRVKGLHREQTHATHKSEPPSLRGWVKKIQASRDIEHALNQTAEALSKSIGVEHCVIMEVDDKDIHTQTCYGYGQQDTMHSFHCDRDKEKHLFNQLIRQPACISLSATDIPKAKQRIPSQFTQHCDLQPCAFLSVFYQNIPKAIIYCDHADWDSQKHHQFKVLGNSLSKTLQQL